MVDGLRDLGCRSSNSLYEFEIRQKRVDEALALVLELMRRLIAGSSGPADLCLRWSEVGPTVSLKSTVSRQETLDRGRTSARKILSGFC